MRLSITNDEAAIEQLGTDSICEDKGLYNLGRYFAWTPGEEDICLDGRFCVRELEAIVYWMKTYGELPKEYGLKKIEEVFWAGCFACVRYPCECEDETIM